MWFIWAVAWFIVEPFEPQTANSARQRFTRNLRLGGVCDEHVGEAKRRVCVGAGAYRGRVLRGVSDDRKQDGGDEGDAHVPRRRGALNCLQDNSTIPRATLLSNLFVPSARIPVPYRALSEICSSSRTEHSDMSCSSGDKIRSETPHHVCVSESRKQPKPLEIETTPLFREVAENVAEGGGAA